jgi:hypothetical protein
MDNQLRGGGIQSHPSDRYLIIEVVERLMA